MSDLPVFLTHEQPSVIRKDPEAERIWDCKIGGVVALPYGADTPMRQAVRDAYRLITGTDPEFIFSGWGGSLTEPERAVVEDRLPLVQTPAMVEMIHGVNCPKKHHEISGGYLHSEDDDTPYDVDHVKHCGRCHEWLPSAQTERRRP